MATVHYKGHKKRIGITFPIGLHNKTAIKETRWAEPNIELSDEDAAKLVALDPHNFELVEEQANEGHEATAKPTRRGSAKR